MYSRGVRHSLKEARQILLDPKDYGSISRMFAGKRGRTPNLPDQQTLLARKWMVDCIPTIQKNTSKMVEQDCFPTMFAFCNKIKLHNSEFYNIVENSLPFKKLEKIHDLDLQQIFRSIINFKHKQNKGLKQNIRNTILKKLKEWSKKYSFFSTVKFIQLIIIDQQLTNSEKQGLIKMIFLRFRDFKSEMKFEQSVDVHFSKIYEMLKVYNIRVDPAFMKLLSQSYSKMKLYSNDLQKKKMITKLLISNQQQKKHFESIFELIFQDFLLKNGYNYESNIFLCNNQYDIFIKGIKKIKHKPLSDFDINSDKLIESQFPLEKLKEIGKSSSVQWIKQQLDFEQKIIIDLHGPCHFIESNNPVIHNTLTKLQQFRYEKLPLYGIYRYNLVYYKQWEKKSKYPGITEQFVKQVIEKAIHLKKIESQK